MFISCLKTKDQALNSIWHILKNPHIYIHLNAKGIFKNTSNQVFMMYKTNTMETEWLGFQIPGKEKQYGIQICRNYLSHYPTIIIPQPLNKENLEQISSNSNFTNWYSSSDLLFWKNLQQNSTQY